MMVIYLSKKFSLRRVTVMFTQFRSLIFDCVLVTLTIVFFLLSKYYIPLREIFWYNHLFCWYAANKKLSYFFI